ncbi:MAG: hypothetical protein PUD07_05875 [bacterium]|nr:hypothetical protein [bacterium]
MNIENYLKSIKECYIQFLKEILGKYYNKNLVLSFLNEYINIRYYNLNEIKFKLLEKNIKYYLNEKALNFINDYDKTLVENNYYFFWYICYLDNIVECPSNKILINKIMLDRQEKLFLENNIIDILEKIIKNIHKIQNDFFSKYESNTFSLKISKTNLKNVYFTNINYDIAFPKIYSNYSINKVYNSSIITEDMHFILYNMISVLLLKNVINNNFDEFYIVTFPLSIILKKDKLNRLINVLRSDIIKNNIVINIKYEDYLNNKDLIDSYIKEGFKFSLELDDKFEFNDNNLIWLEIFSYVYGTQNSLIDKNKLIIKK